MRSILICDQTDVTLAKLDEMLRAFQKADKTNDGLLDKSEFLKLLESVAPVSMGCATLFQRLAEIHCAFLGDATVRYHFFNDISFHS